MRDSIVTTPPEKEQAPAVGAVPTTPPTHEDEETGHLDDAVIGRAFRWSAIAFLLLAAGGAVAWWLAHRPGPPPAPRLTEMRAPIAPPAPVAALPEVRFTDITTASGVRFVHQNGAYGEKLLPETMGGGVAFFDSNSDGHTDLLFVNGTAWPWRSQAGDKPSTAALYRNDGRGHFEDVTAGSGLDVPLYGMGAAVGDYDNDGQVDVFLTAVSENKLFHNEGNGRFRDVTSAAGVGGVTNQWSTACAWLDYDNDGDLDLFVANYVRWSRAIDIEVGYKLVGLGRAYGPPMNFEGTFPYLYRNEGDGRFTEVGQAAGLHVRNPATGVPAAKSLGVAPVDLDGDGWLDLVLANDTVQNFVFRNQRNGTFQEIGAQTGVAFDTYGNTRGAMGIDAARYRDDQALGIAIGNFANEMTALYVATKDPLVFTDEAIVEGVGPASRLLLKFGIVFLDYDLDGRLDLLSANGHLEEDIGKVQASQRYAQPAQLFWNCGTVCGATFQPVPSADPDQALFKPIVGRGSAVADLDNDGDLDVVHTQINGPPLLLRNDQTLGHHWLRLKLVATTGQRDAIGAWVRLRMGSRNHWRQVMPTRSYLSQSELPVTFGLGKETRFDELEIIWPGGARQRVPTARLDDLTIVQQSL